MSYITQELLRECLEALDLSQALLEKSMHHGKILAAERKLRAALAQPEPVASLYISANGEREIDDWKCELPAGRHVLYTTLAQPAKPVNFSYERDSALCEAHCNAESDAYFKARPQLDSDVNRRIFYAGHRRAWITVAAAKGGAV